MQQVNPTQEAKNLNVRLEQDNGEWIAILPPHPDLKSDEEVGFPAPSEQEALDEARAYRAIEQSKVYKFEYDEKRDLYCVTFNENTFSAKLLADAYREAQKAYAEHINATAPPAETPPEPAPKPARKRRANGNGAEREQITSGIGDKPTQLAPPTQTHEDMRIEVQNPWITLDERITNLENVLRDAITATAKALEGLNRK